MLAEDCSCICHLSESEGKYRGWCGTCKFLHPPTNLPGPNTIVPTVDDIFGDWKLERVQKYLRNQIPQGLTYMRMTSGCSLGHELICNLRAEYFPHVQVWAKGL